MKYFTVITGLTLLWSSLGLGRFTSFFLIKDSEIGNIFSSLNLDEWYNTMPIDSKDVLSFCKELDKAQLVSVETTYNIMTVDASITRNFPADDQGTYSANVLINSSGSIKNALGFYCLFQDSSKFIVTNNSYNGHMVFNVNNGVNYDGTQQILLTFDSVVTYFLSYETALLQIKDIIQTYNSNLILQEEYIGTVNRVNVCASVFQGLSSTLIYPHEQYLMIISFNYWQNINSTVLNCKAYVPHIDSFVIHYSMHLSGSKEEPTIQVYHQHVGNIRTTTTFKGKNEAGPSG